MKKGIFTLLILLGFMINFSAFSQKYVKIEDIFDNPGKYTNEQVTVKGIVTQYVPGTAQTTSYFILQSDFGGLINVNTSAKPPVIFKKYKVNGTVIYDQLQGRPLIIERSRALIFPIIIFVLGGVVLLLIVFLITYLLRGSRRKEDEDTSNVKSESDRPDYKTIRIETNGPKTMMLIPGKLEIINGPDRGKSFDITGYPMGDGSSIVTIGRENVSGDRKYAHIQLLERTVSRRQAELIYRSGKLYVKNLSETNLTQVDGRVLDPLVMTELNPGMVIRAGEVEFRYKISE